MNKKIQFIRNYLKRKDREPLIVVIAGIYGAGKTTLSWQLARIFEIKHRTDVGPIIWTIKTRFSQKSSHLLEDLRWIDTIKIQPKRMKTQSKLICQVINNITDSAQRFGKDYFFEGVQLLPQFLKMENIFCYFFLKTPSIKIYAKRLNKSNTHFLRKFSPAHILFFKNKLEKFLLNLVLAYRRTFKKEKDKIIILREKNMNEKIRKIINIIYKILKSKKCGVV